MKAFCFAMYKCLLIFVSDLLVTWLILGIKSNELFQLLLDLWGTYATQLANVLSIICTHYVLEIQTLYPQDQLDS